MSDIMSEAIESVPANAPLDEARELMRREEIGHVVVLVGDAFAGVVSRKDLEYAGRDARVADVIARPAVTATPHTTIREAANLMRGNKVDCLPVLDERERVVGMVTAGDLLDLIGKGLDRETQDPGRRR
ncbi:MAG: CBS domain-containing protein [Myxococcales bacterium]